MSIIQVRNVVKEFKGFAAVQGVSFEVKQGECFGLLGPNGAGKSTLMSMLYGKTLRTRGDLSVFSLDPSKNAQAIKGRLGVVTQDNALDDKLTVAENLILYAAFVGIEKRKRQSRVDELLSYMNLAHKKDAVIQSLSGGMKRRLVFVRAMLNSPELLILDEPTTGLDPAVRHLLWNKVRELHQRGVTILLTTHYMQEAEVLCDRIVIVNQGKIQAEGSPQELIRMHAPGYVGHFEVKTRSAIEALIQSHPLTLHEDASGVWVRSPSLELLSRCITDSIKPLLIRPSNLEDVFLKVTGKELSSDA